MRNAPCAARLLSVVALLVPVVATSPACKGLETNLQDEDVTFLETARQNYESAESAFQGERYTEAVKYFEHVKNKYPYSKYAVLAELRIADTQFAREKWLEAADAYRVFVRFHPRHEQVAYAMFRIAESHSRAIDDDVAWLPMVHGAEKDQTPAKDAVRACDDFLQRFSSDERAGRARELRTAARSHLAAADLYAAAFYAQREKWQGALWRYERVATEYADTAKAPHALLDGARIAADHLDDKATARRLLQQLLTQHPDSAEAADAKTTLAALGA